MTYNKSEIMKQAWNWFNDEDTVMADIEWSSYDMKEKTFANCLKSSWNKAKEYAVKELEEAKELTTSESVKAFDWACKKMNVVINVSDRFKKENVDHEVEHFGYTKTIWQAAMILVKMFIDTNSKEVEYI